MCEGASGRSAAAATTAVAAAAAAAYFVMHVVQQRELPLPLGLHIAAVSYGTPKGTWWERKLSKE